MKSLYYLAFALLVAVGCAGADEIVCEDAVLNVQVESPVAPEVVVVCHNEVLPFQLDDQGCASVVIPAVDAAYIKLFHGRESLRLYVEGGDVAGISFKGGRMASTYLRCPQRCYFLAMALSSLKCLHLWKALNAQNSTLGVSPVGPCLSQAQVLGSFSLGSP